MSECRCLRFKSGAYSACWCKDCEHIKLRCGCTLLPFKSTQIQSFLDFLVELQERKITQAQEEQVQFKFSDITLIFSAKELENLIGLLQQVQLEILREQLERSFSHPTPKLA